MKKEEIISKITGHFGQPLEYYKQVTREPEIVFGRHLIMYYLSEKTNLSSSEIGGIFNQDHATALHAKNKIKDLIFTMDKKYYPIYIEVDNLFSDKKLFANFDEVKEHVENYFPYLDNKNKVIEQLLKIVK